MKHQGNLVIRTQADADKYSGLTEVTGHLYINASALGFAVSQSAYRGPE